MFTIKITTRNLLRKSHSSQVRKTKFLLHLFTESTNQITAYYIPESFDFPTKDLNNKFMS